MNERKIGKIKIASILIIAAFLTMPLIQVTNGYSAKNNKMQNNNLVGVFCEESDSAVNLAKETYLSSISSNSIKLSFSEIKEFTGEVIIFAHGDQNGISLSDKLHFSWQEFASILSEVKAEKIILTSCFGANVINEQYSGPEVIAWKGNVDAILVGYAAALHTEFSEMGSIGIIIENLLSRAYSLVTGKVKPIYLATDPGDIGGGGGGANTESGFVSAYKRQNAGSGITTSRYFWLNFESSLGFDLAGLNLTLLSKIVAILVKLGAISGPAAAIIATAIFVNAILWTISSYNRIRHDFKIGVQGYKYIPDLNFVYHMGYDNYRADGIIPIPNGGLVGYALYLGIVNTPTYWTYFNTGF